MKLAPLAVVLALMGAPAFAQDAFADGVRSSVSANWDQSGLPSSATGIQIEVLVSFGGDGTVLAADLLSSTAPTPEDEAAAFGAAQAAVMKAVGSGAFPIADEDIRVRGVILVFGPNGVTLS
jgi:hypothetical protein